MGWHIIGFPVLIRVTKSNTLIGWFSVVPILLALLIFSGCQQSVSPLEFLQLTQEDEDFNVAIEKGNYRFNCQFLPPQTMALKELPSAIHQQPAINSQQYLTAKEQYSKAGYFKIRVGLNSGEDINLAGLINQQQHANRMGLLSYEMGRYVYLLTASQDTVRALTYEYQKTFGMAPDAIFLFAFPAQATLQNQDHFFDVVFENKVLGNGEKVKFRFEPELLNKALPELSFDQTTASNI